MVNTDISKYYCICITILTECDDGKYGVNCQEDCSHDCAPESCDHLDGMCSHCDEKTEEQCDQDKGKVLFEPWILFIDVLLHCIAH